MITILRLSHRLPRDARITTHCALVARAFGADHFYYSGQHDGNLEKTIQKITQQFGGPFSITYTADPLRFVKEQKKQETIIVHLTVYGISVGDILPELQTQKKNILVIIGGEKVPPEYYHLADFNISVGSQPHSEVAGLAVFLDRYFEGKSIFKKFEDVAVDILPMTHGKKVVPRKQKLLKEDHR